MDVLGKKHENVRYYHPVEGSYAFIPHTFTDTKHHQEIFTNRQFCFVDPRLKLNDSVNHIHANSLRYYVDPSELIYVDWRFGTDTSKQEILSEISTRYKLVKAPSYQKLVENYFNPFYFKKTEVTNREYREFIYWIRDSIFKEAIYASSEFTDEEVFEMIQFPDKGYYSEEDGGRYILYSPVDRELNRNMFHFKQSFDIYKEFTDERILNILEQFCLNTSERWYKRRELDITKLVYTYYETPAFYPSDSVGFFLRDSALQSLNPLIRKIELATYPDTLCWTRDPIYSFNDPMTNMYFWHPAYDHFPVVGISHDQAQAFCHWKEQQLLAAHPELNGKIQLDLPTLYEHENAVTQDQSYYHQAFLEDYDLLTDLLVGDTLAETTRLPLFLGFTQKTHWCVDQDDSAQIKWLKKVLKKQGYAYRPQKENELLLETFLRDAAYMRATQNYIPPGITFLSNNVSEWMSEDYKTHYEKLCEAYINYQCFASLDYCENQRKTDLKNLSQNDTNGYLIIGSNWYDERYEHFFKINVGGLYPKAFKNANQCYSTVGFRYVVRLK